MPDDYAYDPAWDYGYQTTPADTSTMVPAADYGMSAQSAPVAAVAQAPQGGMVGPLSSLGYVYGEPGVGYEDTPVEYSPETLAYFDKLNAYIGGRSPTYGAYSWAMPAQSRTFGGNLKAGGVDVLSEQAFADQDRIYTRYTPESIYSPYLSKPVEENALYQFNLPGSGEKYGSTGNVRVSYNTPIALVDNRTGQLVYSGTGFDAAEKVAAMARQLTQEGGSKAKWSIYTAPPGATDPSQFKQVAEETQNKGILGVLGSILPLALSFIPGFQALSLPAKMAAAAGAGGLGAAIAGNDILKGALLSGATAGLVSGTGLDKALGSALQGTGGLGSAAATGLGQKAAEETGDIVVKGLGSLAQAGGTALGQGALNALGNSLITSTGAKVPTQVDTSNLDTGAVPTSVNTGALSAPNVSPAIGAEYATSVGTLPTPEPDQIVVAANKLQNAADAINSGAGIGQLAAMGLTPEQIDVARQYADQIKGQIVAEGVKPVPVPEAAAVTGGLSALTGPVVNGIDTRTGEIVAEAAKKPIDLPGLSLPLSTFTPPALSQPEPTTLDQEVYENTPITVEGAPEKITDYIAPAALPAIATLPNILQPSLPEPAPAEPSEEPITVKGVPEEINPNYFVPGAEIFTPPTLSQPEPTTTSTTPQKSTLEKISDYLQLAGLASGLLGNLGGGGSGTLGKMPGGFGSGSGIYSAKLPTPGVNGAFAVGGLGGGAGVSAPAGGWTRFGMGNAPVAAAADIPQYGGVNPPGFNTNTWEWLGPQRDNVPMLDTSQLPVKKLAMGGYAVGGPGDGRSDEIPAMLSDGEYVMDAETVALLGNGSNKAGAKQLDKFRANIRKHKGRELARGDFSAKAKKPEAYLSGGRS